MSIEAILTLIIFILPGYFATGVKGFLLVNKPRSDLERTSESVLYSLLIYSFLRIIFFNYNWPISSIKKIIAKPTTLFNAKQLASILLVIVFSFILGYLASLFQKSRFYSTIFSWVKRTPYYRVWDQIFDRKTSALVMLETIQNDKYLGQALITSDSQGEREIYLTNVFLIKPDGTKDELNVKGMLFDSSNLKSIAILD